MSTSAWTQTPTLTSRPSRRRLLQAGGLIVFWALIEAFAASHHWPVPGSLVGLAVLWLLLDRGILPTGWIENGADGLLEHLMLFFAPAMLALVDHPEFLSLLGVKLLAAVLVGTLIVMCGTALVVEIGFRLAASRHDTAR